MSNLLSREYIATNPRLAITKICTFPHLVHFSWVCFAFVVVFFYIKSFWLFILQEISFKIQMNMPSLKNYSNLDMVLNNQKVNVNANEITKN